MPMCGFDENMLQGLGMFYEGLVEALKRNSEQREQPIQETIEQEFFEMNEFEKALAKATDIQQRQTLIGAIYLARSFYETTTLTKGKPDVERLRLLKQQIPVTTSFLEDVDREYYEELRGQRNSMKNLVEYINRGE